MAKTQTVNGETHWRKVAKAFIPSDTPVQKLAIAELHEAAFNSERG